MKLILTPQHQPRQRRSAIGILFLLASSAVALLLAPRLMPEGYSWIIHTTSESAAQGLAGAWLARLGFLSFGMAVLWLARASENIWARGVVWMQLTFGVMMVATATFSHQPWISDVPFDPLENHLHSFTATFMGFAFTFGVVIRFLQRWNQVSSGKMLDLLAALCATFIPMLMLFQPDIAGLVQRLMFLVAYVWFGKEALELYRTVSPSVTHDKPATAPPAGK